MSQGKQLVVADALSMHPLDEDHKSDTVDQVRAYVNTAVTPKLEEICRATQNCAALKKMHHVL